MIGEFLKAWVATQAALTALVGQRVSPNVSRQGDTNPRIVYTQVSGRFLRHLGGLSGERRPRYQLDCYGRTRSEAQQVAELVLALDGYSGTLGGVTVRNAQVADQSDGADDEAGGPEQRPFISLDFFFWHET